MRLKTELRSCESVFQVKQLLKKLSSTVGVLGGRRLVCKEFSGSICHNDVIKTLQQLPIRFKQDVRHFESASIYLVKLERQGDLLLNSACWLLRLLTVVKRFFANLLYNSHLAKVSLNTYAQFVSNKLRLESKLKLWEELERIEKISKQERKELLAEREDLTAKAQQLNKTMTVVKQELRS